MNAGLHIIVASLCLAALTATGANAGMPATASHYQDMIITADSSEPFFTKSVFMLGNEKIAIEQGELPGNRMVSYDEKAHRIIVNNDKSIPETDKGAALLSLMDALTIHDIAPAAGQ